MYVKRHDCIWKSCPWLLSKTIIGIRGAKTVPAINGIFSKRFILLRLLYIVSQIKDDTPLKNLHCTEYVHYHVTPDTNLFLVFPVHEEQKDSRALTTLIFFPSILNTNT